MAKVKNLIESLSPAKRDLHSRYNRKTMDGDVKVKSTFSLDDRRREELIAALMKTCIPALDKPSSPYEQPVEKFSRHVESLYDEEISLEYGTPSLSIH